MHKKAIHANSEMKMQFSEAFLVLFFSVQLQFSEVLVKWRRFFNFLAAQQGKSDMMVLEQRLELEQLKVWSRLRPNLPCHARFHTAAMLYQSQNKFYCCYKCTRKLSLHLPSIQEINTYI